MTRFAFLVSVFLLLITPAARPAADEVGSADAFALASDGVGGIWLVRGGGGRVAAYRWLGDRWLLRWSLPSVGTCRSLSAVVSPEGVFVAWVEGETGGGVALAVAGEAGPRLLRPAALQGAVRQLDLATLKSGRLGLLLIEREGPAARTRWLELETEGFDAVRDLVLSRADAAAFPAILAGGEPWLVWQETRGGELTVAACSVGAEIRTRVLRFAADGFAGAAAPALARDAEGRPIIVWQGTGPGGGAVLRAREVSSEGFGPDSILPLPARVGGALAPRTAVGVQTEVCAQGWGGRFWCGLSYSFGRRGDVAVDVRADATDDIRYPRLALDGEGGEVWVWPREGVLGGELSARRDDELSSAPLAPPDIQAPVEGTIRMLAFGDSITAGKDEDHYDETGEWLTAGYTVYLQDSYCERIAAAEVIQEGISGEDSVQGLVRLASILQQYPDVHYVLILEGTNDINVVGLAPETTAANLGQMVDIVREAGAIPVLGTLLPRFDTDGSRRARAEEISDAIYPMARLRGVTLCDFQALFPKSQLLFSDLRLHPNQEGYELMAGLWLEALVTFLGDIDRSFIVDDEDLLLLSAVLQAQRGSLRYNPDADVNDDGVIDFRDLSAVLSSVGREF